MSRKLPDGAVSAGKMCRKIGICNDTIQQYMASRGLPGYIPADRVAEAEADLQEIKDNSKFGRNRLRQREIADVVGCSVMTVSIYLRRAGWPKIIPRWRFEEAVACVRKGQSLAKENSRMTGKKNIQAALKKRWGRPGAPEEPLEKSRHCNWRVVLLGKKGWLVVRTGTREEMTAWARMLRENGFVAEAAENMYKSEVK